MTEQKIKIKEIKISTEEKTFFITNEKYQQSKDQIDNELAEMQKFIGNNYICEIKKYEKLNFTKYEIIYYFGYIEFFPTLTDSATLKLDIKMDSGFIKLIQSLCLENVVEACDKQTQLFKEMFKESVKDVEKEVNNKLGKSFLSLPFFNKNKID